MITIGSGMGLGCDPGIREIVIDAGEDRTVAAGQTVTLDGSRSRLSPLEFLVGDGDGPREDQLVRYHSETGVSSRTLRDSLNSPLGGPGGMDWVRGALVATEIPARRIVLAVPSSSNVRYLTPPFPDKPLLTALAYDERGDRLLVYEEQNRELCAVDLVSGQASTLARLDALENVTGLAFSVSGDLLAYDEKTRRLYRVEPDTGVVEALCSVQVPEDAICDDLATLRGALYGTITRVTDGVGNVQVCRLDPTTGELTEVGPVIPHTMGHALAIKSAPEDVEWQCVEGPEPVRIASSRSLTTEVELTKAGVYVFRLSVVGSEDLNDTVRITVRER